jgi:glutaminyl-tRNA synthetase
MMTDENGESVQRPDSVVTRTAYAEPLVKEAKAGERFQFFRHGYYIADSKLCTEDEKVFNRIVDLKSSFKIK